MSPRVGLSVARLGDAADVDAAWSEYARVNDASFGHTPDLAQAVAKRPLVEPDRWFLASIDGDLKTVPENRFHTKHRGFPAHSPRPASGGLLLSWLSLRPRAATHLRNSKTCRPDVRTRRSTVWT